MENEDEYWAEGTQVGPCLYSVCDQAPRLLRLVAEMQT